MNDSIMVSICLPVYNDEKTIAKSIESVLNQTHHNFELIISDNCSTDQSYDVMKGFQDTRIKLSQNSENTGFRLNSNKLLASTSGKYVFTLHGDDYFNRADYLERIIEVYEGNDSVGVVHIVPADHKKIYFNGKSHLKSSEYFSLMASLVYMPAPTVTSYRNDAIRNTGYYSENYWTCEARLSLEVASKGYDAFIKKDEGYTVRYFGQEKDSSQLDKIVLIFEHRLTFYKDFKDDKRIKKQDLIKLKKVLEQNYQQLSTWYTSNNDNAVIKSAYERASELYRGIKI
jgi:glycosyltransferase involved in cell wall biosynthesis